MKLKVPRVILAHLGDKYTHRGILEKKGKMFTGAKLKTLLHTFALYVLYFQFTFKSNIDPDDK